MTKTLKTNLTSRSPSKSHQQRDHSEITKIASSSKWFLKKKNWQVINKNKKKQQKKNKINLIFIPRSPSMPLSLKKSSSRRNQQNR